MTRGTKTRVGLAVVVLASTSWTMVLARPDAQYLFAGVMGGPRPDLARVWSLLVPFVAGLGATLAISGIALLRTLREGRPDDALLIATTGAAGVLLLLLVHSLASGGAADRPRNPRTAYEAFTSGQWRTLADTDSPERPSLGPLREAGPGLRDYPGYIPYDPCLLVRRSFLAMSDQEVIDVLGPPLANLNKDGRYPHRYLQYRMVDSTPRRRIANLILRVDPDENQGRHVVGENLYPLRISSDCPQSRY